VVSSAGGRCTRRGDADGDGIIGAFDLAALLGAWGTCPAAPQVCASDMDDDGAVEARDLLRLLADWG
jgi:hypothetical protein